MTRAIAASASAPARSCRACLSRRACGKLLRDAGRRRGVSTQQLVASCTACARDLPVEALTLSAYDPAYDVDGRVIDAATAVVTGVVKESARAR